jgi:TolA-binding protein
MKTALLIPKACLPIRGQRQSTLVLGAIVCALALGLWLGLSTTVFAAASGEEIAFNAAARAFDDGSFDYAERNFAEFIKKFPGSERVPEAILLQARARYKLGQYDQAINLLNSSLGPAGKWADKYRFWMGEAYFQRADFASAAAAYAQMIKDSPDSTLRANACYGEALSWFRLGNMGKTIDLLCQTNSPFQQLSQTWTNDTFVLRGYLLLGEARLLKQDYAGAENTLQSLASRQLPPALEWQRLFLLARVQMDRQQPAAVLAITTNLLAQAKASGLPNQLADTLLLQGEALQLNQQLEAAIQVYEQNLAALPPSAKRKALARLVDWFLSRGNTDKAIKSLETIVKDYPDDPEMDQVCLSLGQLQLKEFYRRQAGGQPTEALSAVTNQLPAALSYFDRVITNYARSPLVGQASLGRGWCLWESGRIVESQAAFKDAAEKLPVSTNQAMARFKWADAQFHLKDYTNAAVNYTAVLDNYASLTNLAPVLLERSLHQLVRARIEMGDLAGCTNTLNRLLSQYPQSEFADRSLMDVGQWLVRQGKRTEGRNYLSQLVTGYPRSPLVPEAKIAIAQALAGEKKWAEALEQYDQWVAQHTNHNALPQVEFDRAWTYSQAGKDTNAMQLFGQFLVRFPKSQLAPYAQNWMGDYFFNQGKYPEAEKNYQLLYENTNWPVSELTYQARLAAGRAAFSRQGYSDATNDFSVLINLLKSDTNSPSSILPSAYIALGDTLIAISASESTNGLQRFAQAINAFLQVPETNRLAPLAWGRIADCHLQLAAQDVARYLQSSNYYQRVINATNAPFASIAARSEAEVGLGIVCEKMANQRPDAERPAVMALALDHYRNVIYLANIQPGEQRDNFWLARAGLEAARILESQGRWAELVALYQRLISLLPPNLHPALEKKLEQAKKRL